MNIYQNCSIRIALCILCFMVCTQFTFGENDYVPGVSVFADTTDSNSDTGKLEATTGGHTDPVNIVFIVTDNQGAWTHGCYGNEDIRTPSIDQLAAEGMLFTRAMSSNPVCSPSRATLLTGLLPSQHGIHSFLDQKYQMGPEAYNAIAEFTTLPEVLAQSGYVCGLTGKWHLGDNLRMADGFSYWTTKPDGGTNSFYDKELIVDGAVQKVAEYTTDFWTRKAIEFIEQNAQNPFFLLLTYNGPYGLSNLMTRPAHNRWADYYKGKHFKSFPVDRMHPWQYHNTQFHNTQTAMERYASEVSGIDDGVGDVMAALRRLGLDSNTLVIYTADQGWMGGQNGIWGMGDHTHPIGAHELMMQVPLIFRHPGIIAVEMTSDLLVSNYDLMITILSYLDLAEDMPAKPRSPGRDFSFALRGEDNRSWHDVIFYEMERLRAVRTDRWKYVSRYPSGPFELYNMEIDPQERFNMYGQPGSEGRNNILKDRVESFFDRFADPQYDVWEDGHSKARLYTPDSLGMYTENYFKER